MMAILSPGLSDSGITRDLAVRSSCLLGITFPRRRCWSLAVIVMVVSSAIAAIVDEGLTRVKANYQVGIGKLDPEVAIDHIVDHAESRAIAYVDNAFDSGMVREVAAEGIVKLAYMIPEMGPIIGPIAENYKPIIKSVIANVEEPVRTAIKTGMHVVATTAKKIAHAAVEKTKEYAVNITKKLVSWLT